jgi:hypothetical protein
MSAECGVPIKGTGAELIDQVIKALECCTNQNCVCNECPYLRKGCRHMKEDALKVLTLIRQRER